MALLTHAHLFDDVLRERSAKHTARAGKKAAAGGMATEEEVDVGDILHHRLTVVPKRHTPPCFEVAVGEAPVPSSSTTPPAPPAVSGDTIAVAGAAAWLAPFSLDMDVCLSVVDEAADQVAFVVQLLRRFDAVMATLTLDGGTATAAGALNSGPRRGKGPAARPASYWQHLAIVVEELANAYVLLENGYLLTSVRHAVYAPAGWAPVRVHDDGGVETYAWADHVFFILSKALSRGIATETPLAAAATCNYVANCLDDTVSAVAAACVIKAGKPRVDLAAYAGWLLQRYEERTAAGVSFIARETSDGSAGSRSGSPTFTLASERSSVGGGHAGGVGGGGSVGRASNVDELEEELMGALAASWGGGAGTRGSSFASAGADARQRSQGVGTPTSDAPEPDVPSRDAIIALNTVATAADFAGKLYRRARGDFELAYPAPAPSHDAPACLPLLRPSLQLFGDAAHALQARVPTAAAALANTCLSPGLEVVASWRRAIRYDAGLDGTPRAGGTTMLPPSMSAGVGTGAGLSGSHLVPLVRNPVLHGGSVWPTLRLLWRPTVTDAFVRAVAARLASALDTLILSTAPVTEFGALALSGELRDLSSTLAGHVSTGSLKREFARPLQMAAILALDAPHELYDLVGVSGGGGGGLPSQWRWVLTRDEVALLLANRFGEDGVVAAAIVWARIGL